MYTKYAHHIDKRLTLHPYHISIRYTCISSTVLFDMNTLCAVTSTLIWILLKNYKVVNFTIFAKFSIELIMLCECKSVCACVSVWWHYVDVFCVNTASFTLIYQCLFYPEFVCEFFFVARSLLLNLNLFDVFCVHFESLQTQNNFVRYFSSN